MAENEQAEPVDGDVAVPPPSPRATIVSDRSRVQTIDLEWPVEFDGVTYNSVTVKRITGREVAAYVEAISKGGDIKPPMLDCPQEVYDAMDADDFIKVDEVLRDFLPRTFRQAVASPPEATDKSPA